MLISLTCFSCTGAGALRMKEVVIYPRPGYPDLVEGKRIVRGRINFAPVEKGCVPQVTIVRASGERDIASWPEAIQPGAVIDPAEEYDVEMFTSVISDPNLPSRHEVSNEVFKVSEGGRTVVDASICYLHQLSMRRHIEIQVALEDYGSVMKEYFKGNNFTPKLFPNDGKAYLGCGVGPDGATWQCSRCYILSEQWRKEHHIR